MEQRRMPRHAIVEEAGKLTDNETALLKYAAKHGGIGYSNTRDEGPGLMPFDSAGYEHFVYELQALGFSRSAFELETLQAARSLSEKGLIELVRRPFPTGKYYLTSSGGLVLGAKISAEVAQEQSLIDAFRDYDTRPAIGSRSATEQVQDAQQVGHLLREASIAFDRKGVSGIGEALSEVNTILERASRILRPYGYGGFSEEGGDSGE
ncbi:MAG: hypothetical protein KGH72_06060 [Candidatus Micrarchaeota archaeon]|nr:hypothetical protein [Candidatus Micrarchaeota archaeon]